MREREGEKGEGGRRRKSFSKYLQKTIFATTILEILQKNSDKFSTRTKKPMA